MNTKKSCSITVHIVIMKVSTNGFCEDIWVGGVGGDGEDSNATACHQQHIQVYQAEEY